MTYDPERYWPERYQRQGPTYVARGGRKRDYALEQSAIAPFLRRVVVGPRVLDFGCGVGRFRDVLGEGREYTGVDLIPGLGTQPLVRELPRGFDTAVAIMVLQHITDELVYRHWANELFECLNPGGRLVVVDHNTIEKPGAHMRPRGRRFLISTAPWRSITTSTPYDGHWCGWLLK